MEEKRANKAALILKRALHPDTVLFEFNAILFIFFEGNFSFIYDMLWIFLLKLEKLEFNANTLEKEEVYGMILNK